MVVSRTAKLDDFTVEFGSTRAGFTMAASCSTDCPTAHANARAGRFYEYFGFRALSAAPRTLMVTLAELRAAGYR